MKHYKGRSVEVGVFRKEWVTLSANFRGKGASPTNHCWCQKNKVIALSCGIKISAVHCLVLSQSTRVTDRRTNRQTDGQTDRITTANTALAYSCSRGKNVHGVVSDFRLECFCFSHPVGYIGFDVAPHHKRFYTVVCFQSLETNNSVEPLVV